MVRHKLGWNDHSVPYSRLPLCEGGIVSKNDLLREGGAGVPRKDLRETLIWSLYDVHKEGSFMHRGRWIDVAVHAPTQRDDYKGSEAKPTRSEKVEVGLIFGFQCGGKPDVYPLRYMEDFSTC
jgi:hypothetical protein